jgi:hypothetical protein
MQSYPSVPSTQQSAAHKSRGCQFFLGLLTAACVIVGVVQFHTFMVYRSYEQGRCLLQSGGAIGNGGKGHPWQVSFHYLVSTTADQVESQGYDLPASTFSSRADAQSVVKTYTIGRTYPCWYNPQKPTSAALVLHDRSLIDFVEPILGSSVLYVGLLLFVLFLITGLFYDAVYLPACLIVRGIVTQGQVREHITRRRKRGNILFSRIIYQRQEFPYDWQSFEVAGTYPIGSWQPVCYDPARLTNVRRGDRPPGTDLILNLLFGLALVWGVGAVLVWVWNQV